MALGLYFRPAATEPTIERTDQVSIGRTVYADAGGQVAIGVTVQPDADGVRFYVAPGTYDLRVHRDGEGVVFTEEITVEGAAAAGDGIGDQVHVTLNGDNGGAGTALFTSDPATIDGSSMSWDEPSMTLTFEEAGVYYVQGSVSGVGNLAAAGYMEMTHSAPADNPQVQIPTGAAAFHNFAVSLVEKFAAGGTAVIEPDVEKGSSLTPTVAISATRLA